MQSLHVGKSADASDPGSIDHDRAIIDRLARHRRHGA
jgi:hypothetical protein